MRVGLFTDIYLPTVYGTELATERVRVTLEAMGHKVFVFAPETPGYADASPRVLRFRSQRISKNPESRLAFSFLPIGRSYREVLDFRLDVAQAQTMGAMGMLARRMALHQGIPLLYAHHSMYPGYVGSESGDDLLVPSLVRSYTKWFAGRSDAILAPTVKVKRLFEEWGLDADIPVHVVPTGVDTTKFRRSASVRRRLRRTLGIAETATVLLTVSRLVREKNLDFLLEAFRRIARRAPGSRLLLVGEGNYRDSLEKRARKLGIASRTDFAGLVPHGEVAAYYQAADLFVFPSVVESQGLVILEALASGLPVVALKDEAYERFVVDGKSGVLVEPQSPARFAQRALPLVRDRSLRQKASRWAARTSREYTLEKTAAMLVEVYRAMIRELRARRPRKRAQGAAR
jgi:1,2-diacylglycerol 3-alpha-glucosyltransferase